MIHLPNQFGFKNMGAVKLQSERTASVVSFPDQLDIDENRMAVTVPFADGSRRDGVGDVIEVGGIDFSRHMRNPVVLWEHGKANVSMPIAMAEDPDTKEYTVVIDEANRMAKGKAFFYQGNDAHGIFCEQLFHLICKKFIRGGSIGYQVIQANPIPPDMSGEGPPVQGMHLIKTMMLEYSVVVIPANGDTVLKSANWLDWRERAREILCQPSLCGKSLALPLRKSLEPYAAEGKVMSNGVGTKGAEQFKVGDRVTDDPHSSNVGVVKEVKPNAVVVTFPTDPDGWVTYRGSEINDLQKKAMSHLDESRGGALVKPAEQGTKSEGTWSLIDPNGKVTFQGTHQQVVDALVALGERASGWQIKPSTETKDVPKDTESPVNPPLTGNLSETNVPPARWKPGVGAEKMKQIRQKYKAIQTKGYQEVEVNQLKQGDLVHQADGSAKPVRYVSGRTIVYMDGERFTVDVGYKINVVKSMATAKTKAANLQIAQVYQNAARASAQEIDNAIASLRGMSKDDLRQTMEEMGFRVRPSDSGTAIAKEIEKYIRARSGASQRMGIIRLSGADLGEKKSINMETKAQKWISDVEAGEIVRIIEQGWPVDKKVQSTSFRNGMYTLIFEDGTRLTGNEAMAVATKSINVRFKRKVVKGYASVQMKFDVSGMDTKRQNLFVKEMKDCGFGHPSGGRWSGEGDEKALDAPLKTANYAFDLEPGKNLAEAIGKAQAVGEKHGAKYLGNTKSIQGQTKATDAEWESYGREMEKIGVGRVAIINGHKVKRTKLGYIEVDGSHPVPPQMALKIIANEKEGYGKSGANMKTKSADGQLPDDVQPVEEEKSGPAEFHLKESLGSQVLKRFHEDHSALMQQYDEILPVLDHSDVKAFLEEKLKGWEKDLSHVEKSHKKWFKDVEPIAGSMDEAVDELEEETVDKDHLPGEIDNAGNADSDPSPEPTPDEALEGMDKIDEEETPEEKALRVKQTKSIRAKYRMKANHVQASSASPGDEVFDPARGYGKVQSVSGEKVVVVWNDGRTEIYGGASGRSLAVLQSAKSMTKDLTSDEANVIKDDMVDQAADTEDGVKWFKGLAEHQQGHVTEAKGYLKELGETPDEGFTHEHRMKAYHHGTNLEGIEGKDLTEDEADVIKDEMVDQAADTKDLTENEAEVIKDEMVEQADDNVQKSLRKAVKNAGCYLKELAGSERFSEDERQKAVSLCKDLDEIEAEEKAEEVDDVPPEDEGAMQTKAAEEIEELKEKALSRSKQMDELSQSLKRLEGLVSK